NPEDDLRIVCWHRVGLREVTFVTVDGAAQQQERGFVRLYHLSAKEAAVAGAQIQVLLRAFQKGENARRKPFLRELAAIARLKGKTVRIRGVRLRVKLQRSPKVNGVLLRVICHVRAQGRVGGAVAARVTEAVVHRAG